MHSRQFMRLSAGVLLLALGTGEAIARPDTRTMTCAQAQTMVQQYNAIVLTTGQHTFSRFVKGQGFCEPGQVTARGTAPTMDNKKCPVGNLCRDRIVSR